MTAPKEWLPEDEWREAHQHPCPAPGCGQWIANGYVGCARHYGRLPREERALLAEAFRVRVQAPDIYALAVERTRRLLGAL